MSEFKTIDQILATDDLKVTEVDVEQWGCSVSVREMSAEDRAAIEKLFAGHDTDPFRFRVELLSRCCCNQDGSAFMSRDQAAALMKKNGAAVETIIDKAIALNKFRNLEGEAGNS